MKYTSIFVTDFDGTLARDDRSMSSKDLESLEGLREQGCAVVLASGRSPFSLWRSLDGRKLPVDWFVLSSGAGVMNSRGTVKLSHLLSPGDTSEIHSALSSLGIRDISIQGPFPDAHKLHWIPGNHGSDFRKRLEFYRGYSQEIESPEMESSEIIGFVSPELADGVLSELASLIGDRYSIIRATSPLDHRTVWIEVFPAGVNKGSGCEFICSELGVQKENTAAVGNDWNDVHMLEWASTSFVVSNAPEALRKKFMNVASNEDNGVADAVSRWLEMRK